MICGAAYATGSRSLADSCGSCGTSFVVDVGAVVSLLRGADIDEDWPVSRLTDVGNRGQELQVPQEVVRNPGSVPMTSVGDVASKVPTAVVTGNGEYIVVLQATANGDDGSSSASTSDASAKPVSAATGDHGHAFGAPTTALHPLQAILETPIAEAFSRRAASTPPSQPKVACRVVTVVLGGTGNIIIIIIVRVVVVVIVATAISISASGCAILQAFSYYHSTLILAHHC